MREVEELDAGMEYCFRDKKVVDRKQRAKLAFAKPVVIGDDAWFGGNGTILPDVTIGSNVIIAAGAMVSRDLPDNCVAAGVPVRAVRTLENDL